MSEPTLAPTDVLAEGRPPPAPAPVVKNPVFDKFVQDQLDENRAAKLKDNKVQPTVDEIEGPTKTTFGAYNPEVLWSADEELERINATPSSIFESAVNATDGKDYPIDSPFRDRYGRKRSAGILDVEVEYYEIDPTVSLEDKLSMTPPLDVMAEFWPRERELSEAVGGNKSIYPTIYLYRPATWNNKLKKRTQPDMFYNIAVVPTSMLQAMVDLFFITQPAADILRQYTRDTDSSTLNASQGFCFGFEGAGIVKADQPSMKNIDKWCPDIARQSALLWANVQFLFGAALRRLVTKVGERWSAIVDQFSWLAIQAATQNPYDIVGVSCFKKIAESLIGCGMARNSVQEAIDRVDTILNSYRFGTGQSVRVEHDSIEGWTEASMKTRTWLFPDAQHRSTALAVARIRFEELGVPRTKADAALRRNQFNPLLMAKKLRKSVDPAWKMAINTFPKVNPFSESAADAALRLKKEQDNVLSLKPGESSNSKTMLSVKLSNPMKIDDDLLRSRRSDALKRQKKEGKQKQDSKLVLDAAKADRIGVKDIPLPKSKPIKATPTFKEKQKILQDHAKKVNKEQNFPTLGGAPADIVRLLTDKGVQTPFGKLPAEFVGDHKGFFDLCELRFPSSSDFTLYKIKPPAYIQPVYSQSHAAKDWYVKKGVPPGLINQAIAYPHTVDEYNKPAVPVIITENDNRQPEDHEIGLKYGSDIESIPSISPSDSISAIDVALPPSPEGTMPPPPKADRAWSFDAATRAFTKATRFSRAKSTTITDIESAPAASIPWYTKLTSYFAPKEVIPPTAHKRGIFRRYIGGWYMTVKDLINYDFVFVSGDEEAASKHQNYLNFMGRSDNRRNEGISARRRTLWGRFRARYLEHYVDHSWARAGKWGAYLTFGIPATFYHVYSKLVEVVRADDTPAMLKVSNVIMGIVMAPLAAQISFFGLFIGTQITFYEICGETAFAIVDWATRDDYDESLT